MVGEGPKESIQKSSSHDREDGTDTPATPESEYVKAQVEAVGVDFDVLSPEGGLSVQSQADTERAEARADIEANNGQLDLDVFDPAEGSLVDLLGREDEARRNEAAGTQERNAEIIGPAYENFSKALDEILDRGGNTMILQKDPAQFDPNGYETFLRNSLKQYLEELNTSEILKADREIDVAVIEKTMELFQGGGKIEILIEDYVTEKATSIVESFLEVSEAKEGLLYDIRLTFNQANQESIASAFVNYITISIVDYIEGGEDGTIEDYLMDNNRFARHEAFFIRARDLMSRTLTQFGVPVRRS